MAAEFSQGTSLSGYWGQNFAFKKDADQWLIQAGITKNWFGLGNTALFGEYSKSNDWGAGNGLGRDFAAPVGVGNVVAVNDVTATELTVWGIGITQNIDAAATELYLNYRHFSADITAEGAGRADRGLRRGHRRRPYEVLILNPITRSYERAAFWAALLLMGLARRSRSRPSVAADISCLKAASLRSARLPRAGGNEVLC